MPSSRLILSALVLVAVLGIAALFFGKDAKPPTGAVAKVPSSQQATGPSEDHVDLRQPVLEEAEQRTAKGIQKAPDQIDEEQRPQPDVDNGRALALVKVAVLAQTTSAEPLVDAMEACLADLPLGAAVSLEPFGDWVPLERDLFSRGEGAARVDGVTGKGAQIAELSLLADPPLWVALTLGPKVLASQTLNKGEHEVRFQLDPGQLDGALGALRFQVIDGPTGAPLPNAVVLVSSGLPRIYRSLTADSEGSVNLEPWYVGPCQLSIFGPQSGWVRFELQTQPGPLTDAGRLELWPGVEIEGLVLDANAQALEGIQVQARQAEHSMPQYLANSDQQGRFNYRLSPGTWFFWAVDKGENKSEAFSTARIDVARDQANGLVQLQLAPAAPFVLQASEAWARRATFRVAVHGREVVRAGNLVLEPVWREILPLGGYDVELVGPSGEVLQRVEVAHGPEGTRILLDRL